MKRGVRDVGLLLLTGVLAVSATLAWRQWTGPVIAGAEKQLQSRQRLAVLPDGSYDNQPLESPLPRPAAQRPNSRILAAYRATMAGKPSAIILITQAQGYAGPIVLSVAITTDGRLIGSQVVEQQESPGLGDRLGDPRLHWLSQFNNRDHGDHWALKRDQGDFDQLAGATVTSRAVIAALQDALSYFDEQRSVLLEGATHE
ncbi:MULTISPECIES: RnfABCDGE type electron transport complex subunit G [Pseudomonas]|jgi:electron transport complex protein RnfG|uniref:Ion-translocating oxidoreductase complex subunit G n=2 Tax=Pseudomonas putida group TaxID=136845 RepID=Q88NW0_PSEPK|nr:MULTISPECIES: RnfABCDGE type electron transport complex subunit G [Pseudomonas]AAN66719.1 putative electron transport complex protein [Pseudomonas putida KT2440]KMU92855.1 electron transporter RnfG [Pseudomonas putida]KMY37340.1 electron transporter RnfG [Pseudomonas putida]MCE0862207.1 RnfABCDGE type electron transport complex subunit G [Pseudomonas alloputida]MCE0868287.1 RnfABCDGE type electron transport complex subunit G [Pseudomonas alloputida]